MRGAAGRRAPEDERQGAAHDERRGEVRRAAVDLKFRRSGDGNRTTLRSWIKTLKATTQPTLNLLALVSGPCAI